MPTYLINANSPAEISINYQHGDQIQFADLAMEPYLNLELLNRGLLIFNVLVKKAEGTQQISLHINTANNSYLDLSNIKFLLEDGGQLVFAAPGTQNINTSHDDIVWSSATGGIIHGGEGNDKLHGWEGKDTLFGDSGNDVLTGSVGDALYGGEGNDKLQGYESYLDGGSGNDQLFGHKSIVHGGSGNDLVAGGEGDEQLFGDDGNDLMIGSAFRFFNQIAGTDSVMRGSLGYGVDLIDGGQGEDILFYEGEFKRFTMTKTTDGITIHDVLGIAGTDQITNVEYFVFDDAAISFSADTQLAKVYRLYQAAFGRTPDKEGLSYWFNDILHKGASLLDVANGFVNSPEFKTLYGENQDTDLILHGFYQHILSREPDPEGLAYWKKELQTGKLNLAGVLTSFSESPENYSITKGSLESGIRFTFQPIDIRHPENLYRIGDELNNVLTTDNQNDYLDGQAGNDILNGKGGNDTLIGGEGNDTLVGGSGDDRLTDLDGENTILAGDGNDRIYLGAGHNTVDGGAGIDIAYFSTRNITAPIPGTQANSTLSVSKQGDKIVVRDLSYPANSAEMSNVERVQIAFTYPEGTAIKQEIKYFAFDIEGNAGEVYKLVQAAVGNHLDSKLKEYFIGTYLLERDAGLSLSELTKHMIHDERISDLYQAGSNADAIINTIYQNALERQPTLNELNDLRIAFNEGSMSTADLIMSLSQGSEFTTRIVGQMGDHVEYYLDWAFI